VTARITAASVPASRLISTAPPWTMATAPGNPISAASSTGTRPC
jgi:hypothetical protein